MRLWLIPVEAFLLGSIPFGYLLFRATTGGDIRRGGSGNIGATNVMRRAGKALGIATLVLDAAKGYLALAIAGAWAAATVQQPEMFSATGASLPTWHYAWLAAGIVAAMLGHMFTPWLGWRGGKGVATALGVFLWLAPWPTLAAVALFVAVLLLTRYVSAASILASLAFPLLLLWRYGPGYPWPIYLAVTASVVLIVIRHRGNIRRLLAGNESRFGRRATA
ncbi:MAG: glycerol-3-phosphate 1-O-acyltransferase PlsY [Terriglobales bacterium]